MFYKKGDLQIPLHVHLTLYELNMYMLFFHKEPLYKKLSTTHSEI